MNFWKKLVCGTLAASLLLAGCASQDMSWAYRADGVQTPVGVYIFNMIDAAAEAETKLTELHEGDENYQVPDKFKDVLGERLEDRTVAEFIQSGAEKRMRDYVAIERKHDEMGLIFSDSQKAYAANSAASYWNDNKELYEANGVAESSIRLLFESNIKKQNLFNAIYGSGGEKEISVEEQKAALEKNFAKVDAMLLYKEAGEDAQVMREEAEEYLRRAQAGEDFYELSYELDKSQAGEGNEDSVTKPEEGSRAVIFSEDMKSTYGEAIVNAAFEAQPGQPVMVEDSYYYYIFSRRDIHEDPDTLSAYYDDIVELLKGEEFESEVGQWADAVSLESNQAALDRYQPSKLKL